ncbi:MAG: hypothetical protein HY912_15415 [Desulfomonile tiedjei]|uniref:DUF7133 domain-containing protein n=1 Tax=Desulfomonile tiedjei TaxID=2358 RepID=A0A9D6Z4F4_9BACT|nr:hypothetical protein [Desulfomonile tiedjei]
MTKNKLVMAFLGLTCLASVSCFCQPSLLGAGLALDRISLPPGFIISLYAKNIKGARSMCVGPNGVLYVGTRDEGKVHAILDRDRDGIADEVHVIASHLNSPNGVAFRDGALYVSEINRILRFDNIEPKLKNPPKPVVLNDNFPKEKDHGWKFIRYGPDGMLYVPVGAP